MGRKRLELNEEQLEEFKLLCKSGCSHQEIADSLMVGIKAVRLLLTREPYRTIHTQSNARINRRLRSVQIAEALKGNTTLLIWLGKQRLGQTDTVTLSSQTGGQVVKYKVPDNERGDGESN